MSEIEKARGEVAPRRELTLKDVALRNPVPFAIGMTSLGLGLGALTYAFLAIMHNVVRSAAVSPGVVMIAATGIVGLGLAIVFLSMALFGKAGAAAQNVHHELEGVEFSRLSLDQLHTLVDHYRKQGNLAEADRVSSHLLALSEHDAAAEQEN